PVDAPGAADDAVARPRALAHPRREDLAADQAQRARVAQHLQALERRELLGGSGDFDEGHDAAPRQRTALWPPNPNEVDSAPSAVFSALVSERSLSGVDVPCALT